MKNLFKLMIVGVFCYGTPAIACDYKDNCGKALALDANNGLSPYARQRILNNSKNAERYLRIFPSAQGKVRQQAKTCFAKRQKLL